ncbi:MAG: MotA/TolQ/ExbB proton channel family protein [Gammaproteobacteria bacterium]|nr:MotA/TolQ/ExbB proton channel family protein [Gammaproteobacteria bacterium]
MDLATLIGLIIGAAVIAMAMLSGSDITIFINVPGLLIVFGGTFAATLIKFPIGDCFRAIGLATKKAFLQEADHPAELIQLANTLTETVRKKNIIALEDVEIENTFFKKGIQLCTDGHKPDFIRNVLVKEMNLSIERHEMGEKVFRAMGESAPAFGMIGTLVGLVQMLSSLEDPSAIGPAMAVALLTTLYGALFANLVALPIADKLRSRTDQERINKSLIIESVIGILQGVNPRILDELLESYLPVNKRHVIGNKDIEPPESTSGDTADETA